MTSNENELVAALELAIESISNLLKELREGGERPRLPQQQGWKYKDLPAVFRHEVPEGTPTHKERCCRWCDKEFLAPLIQVRALASGKLSFNYRGFCSKECQKQLRAAEAAGGHYRAAVASKNCAYCGSTYKPTQERSLFCSRKCMMEHRSQTWQEVWKKTRQGS